MCDCIKKYQDALKQYNTKLDLPMFLRPHVDVVAVVTTKIEKKARQGPITILASYCPFCGEKYPESNP